MRVDAGSGAVTKAGVAGAALVAPLARRTGVGLHGGRRGYRDRGRPDRDGHRGASTRRPAVRAGDAQRGGLDAQCGGRTTSSVDLAPAPTYTGDVGMHAAHAIAELGAVSVWMSFGRGHAWAGHRYMFYLCSPAEVGEDG